LRSILEFKKILPLFLDFKKAWNRANVASPIPSKIYFFVERFLEKGLWFSKQENIFTRANLFGGGNYFAPPFNPPNPVSSRGD
jgi:hypothetical protein